VILTADAIALPRGKNHISSEVGLDDHL